MSKEEKRQKDREYYKLHREKIIARVAEYQRTKREQFNKYQRDYVAMKRREDPEWKAKRDAYWRDYYRRTIAQREVYKATQYNSMKDLARRQARNAMASGKLPRPDSCDACRKPCKPQMHHPDYSKPLSVIWLCGLCHGVVHSKGPSLSLLSDSKNQQ